MWVWPDVIFEGDYGSYAVNEWIANPDAGARVITIRGYSEGNFWRGMSAKGAADVPMYLDCRWEDTAPMSPADPPPLLPDLPALTAQGAMDYVCINRHSGSINVAFLDSSVRKVGLKGLWKLKWHRTYKTDALPPVWPAWMKNFGSYY